MGKWPVVCVLGHRGMLGHVVARYLKEQGCDVATISTRFQVGYENEFMDAIIQCEPEWVINCIGQSKPSSIERLNEVNFHLPDTCAKFLPSSVRLIHASSDAVFVPSKPGRMAMDMPDAEDAYGLSKRNAESALNSDRCFIIRCSIIGPELATNRYLLSWFLSECNTVSGYTDHWWNGITTLEWASLCFQAIAGADQASWPVLQPGIWPPMTKYELLQVISEVWARRVSIRPVESFQPVLRTLIPNLESPPLVAQLRRLKHWYQNEEASLKTFIDREQH